MRNTELYNAIKTNDWDHAVALLETGNRNFDMCDPKDMLKPTELVADMWFGVKNSTYIDKNQVISYAKNIIKFVEKLVSTIDIPDLMQEEININQFKVALERDILASVNKYLKQRNSVWGIIVTWLRELTISGKEVSLERLADAYNIIKCVLAADREKIDDLLVVSYIEALAARKKTSFFHSKLHDDLMYKLTSKVRAEVLKVDNNDYYKKGILYFRTRDAYKLRLMQTQLERLKHNLMTNEQERSAIYLNLREEKRNNKKLSESLYRYTMESNQYLAEQKMYQKSIEQTKQAYLMQKNQNHDSKRRIKELESAIESEKLSKKKSSEQILQLKEELSVQRRASMEEVYALRQQLQELENSLSLSEKPAKLNLADNVKDNMEFNILEHSEPIVFNRHIHHQSKSFTQPDNDLEIVISKQKPDAIVPKPLVLNEKSSYDEEFTFVSHNKV